MIVGGGRSEDCSCEGAGVFVPPLTYLFRSLFSRCVDENSVAGSGDRDVPAGSDTMMFCVTMKATSCTVAHRMPE